jgi:hypothetical protein
MAGGGGAARPRPMATSRSPSIGFASATGANATCNSGTGTSVANAAPAKAQGWCSTDLPFDGSSLCSLPDLSIQTVWVSMPVQMVSIKPRSADGIKPDGMITRTDRASSISAAAKFLNGKNARITRALCARDFAHASAYPFHSRRSSATRSTS